VLIDTHCHLTDPAFDPDRSAVLERMRAAGVGRALVIESVPSRLAATLAWVASEPGFAVATACHPHDASKYAALEGQFRDAWASPLVRAVGEIGLDYHYDHAPRPVQRDAFAAQLDIATDAGKPVVIHAREADSDVVEILRGRADATVVLHSFSSGTFLRDAGLNSGWYFSFSGMVTFRSWQQLDAVRSVPPNRLLVETDAPYLAPVPHRGSRNEPAFVTSTAARVAEIRGEDPAAVAIATTANAMRLFWPGETAG
jgi:TatD DNase family protein